MRLQEFINDFNRLDKPKNFPYKLVASYQYIWNDTDMLNAKTYKIILFVYYIGDVDGELDTKHILFKIEDEIDIDKIDYHITIEKTIIETFNKIKFQDT